MSTTGAGVSYALGQQKMAPLQDPRRHHLLDTEYAGRIRPVRHRFRRPGDTKRVGRVAGATGAALQFGCRRHDRGLVPVGAAGGCFRTAQYHIGLSLADYCRPLPDGGGAVAEHGNRRPVRHGPGNRGDPREPEYHGRRVLIRGAAQLCLELHAFRIPGRHHHCGPRCRRRHRRVRLAFHFRGCGNGVGDHDSHRLRGAPGIGGLPPQQTAAKRIGTCQPDTDPDRPARAHGSPGKTRDRREDPVHPGVRSRDPYLDVPRSGAASSARSEPCSSSRAGCPQSSPARDWHLPKASP